MTDDQSENLDRVRNELAREQLALKTAQDQAAHWKEIAHRLQEKLDAQKGKRWT